MFTLVLVDMHTGMQGPTLAHSDVCIKAIDTSMPVIH